MCPDSYNYVIHTGVFLIISFASLKLPLVYMRHLLLFVNLIIDQLYFCSVANVYLYDSLSGWKCSSAAFSAIPHLQRTFLVILMLRDAHS
jgi:hypothetical protein